MNLRKEKEKEYETPKQKEIIHSYISQNSKDQILQNHMLKDHFP